MRGLHELNSPVDGCSGGLKVKGDLGVTEVRMVEIELIILHPFGINRQTVLLDEGLQDALLFKGAKKIIFSHKVRRDKFDCPAYL